MIGDTWYPISSTRTLNYFLVDAAKNKTIVHQLDLIGDFIQANVKDRFLVKLDSRYGEYFPEYSNYYGRPSKLNKSMYKITNSGNLFSDELTNFMIEQSGFKNSKFQMSVYYKYAQDDSKLVVLSYVDDCVYWYTYE